MSSILATLSAQDESSCALVQDTLASVGKLEALWQSQEVVNPLMLCALIICHSHIGVHNSVHLLQEKHRKMLLLEQEKKLLLEKEASTAAHNDQLLQTLTARVSKEKSMARECNAQQQRNEELDRELNQTLAKCANLQRDLDEKISELTREEMRRKTEVDDATKAGREEMDRALHTLRQEKALELKTLEDLHSKKLAMLKREYDEKMILFSASAPTRAPSACITVSEAQLKQSLQEARCEIEVLKDKLKMKVLPSNLIAFVVSEKAVFYGLTGLDVCCFALNLDRTCRHSL